MPLIRVIEIRSLSLYQNISFTHPSKYARYMSNRSLIKYIGYGPESKLFGYTLFVDINGLIQVQDINITQLPCLVFSFLLCIPCFQRIFLVRTYLSSMQLVLCRVADVKRLPVQIIYTVHKK